MFQCQECRKLFRTTAAAEKASNDGCPKCGGCDIDIAPLEERSASKKADAIKAAYNRINARSQS